MTGVPFRIGVPGECKNCNKPLISYRTYSGNWNHYHVSASRQSCHGSWAKWAEPKVDPEESA